MSTPSPLDQLNAFLRSELSAVRSYEQALQKVKQPDAREELETAKSSHAKRAETLRRRIRELGGAPTEGTGAWGAFINALEKIAAAIGDQSAIAVLEEGEDHGLAVYKVDLSALDADTRRIVEMELVPAQESTHRALSSLKAALH